MKLVKAIKAIEFLTLPFRIINSLLKGEWWGCTKCGNITFIKPSSYWCNDCKDGRMEYMRKYYQAPKWKEYMRKYMRKYCQTPKYKECERKYQQTSKYKEYKRKYRQRKRYEMIEGYIKSVVNRK